LIFNKLSVGFEIDFLLSAPGRAYLAFCPEKERNEILGNLKKLTKYSFLFETGQMSHILDQVRAQGFGHRDSRWGGRASEFTSTYDDGLDAIAVPIRSGNSVLGCVNIVWIRSILPRRTVVDRHLVNLLETADRIAVAAVR
jgi:IclR family mhp operon transcriptional activator